MKNYSKRMIAFALAIVVALTAVLFTAYADDDYSDESLVLWAELLLENGGEYTSVGKVDPGDELKARISIGISYYTTAADILVFYDETFFEDSYTVNETEFNPMRNYESEQCTGMSVMRTKLDDSNKMLQNLVTNGYLDKDYLDTHQAFIYNVYFTDSATHTFNEYEWMFEFDLKVREDASGSGDFGFVYDTVARVDTNEKAYINIPYNTVDGNSFTSTSLFNLDIPTTIYNAVATTLDEPATTYPPETTTEKVEPTTAPAETTTVPAETTTLESETTTLAEATTLPAESTTQEESTQEATTAPGVTDSQVTTTQQASSDVFETTQPQTALTTVVAPTTAVTIPDYSEIPTATTTKAQFTTAVPEEKTTVSITIGIRNPTEKVIKYGDGIILHAETSRSLPEGYSIVWEADNDCFTLSPSDDGSTCTVISAVSGTATFTAKVVDEDGNVIATSGNRQIQSKAGLFWKIIAFFKKLFGLTKLYPEFIY